MRLPPASAPGSAGGLQRPRPPAEKVGSHTTLDHPVEKSFPRHCVLGTKCYLILRNAQLDCDVVAVLSVSVESVAPPEVRYTSSQKHKIR